MRASAATIHRFSEAMKAIQTILENEIMDLVEGVMDTNGMHVSE